MSLNPLFSIIIPVYNLEGFLEECINSILQQNFDDYEIIIINDGSTDKSKEICNDYNDKSNKILVYHQKNSGVSEARNKGVELAKGKYIWFVDGDDIIEKNALEKLDKTLGSYNYDLDVLGFSFKKKDNDNTFEVVNKTEILKPENGNEFTKSYTRLALWTFLYKRELIVNSGIRFNKKLSYFEDNFFNIQVFNISNTIIQTNYHLYVYRINRLGSAMDQEKKNDIQDSILHILKSLSLLKLVLLSKENMGIVKTSFWESFLHYIDFDYELTEERKRMLSIDLYNFTGILNKSWHKEAYIKYDIIIYNFFKKRYLLVRNNSLLILLRKVVIKMNLIFFN